MSNGETINSESSNERRATSNGNVAWWHWHKRLYNWVVHWADTRYGMLALILLALTEPICVPIPADVMVVGLCLGRPKRSLRYGLTCAFFSVLGGTIAFSLGLAIGPERLEHFLGFVAQLLEWMSFGLIDLEDKVQKALQIYQKYNVWAIAVSALTPVPYMIFSWVGGAMANVSVLKFVVISVIFRTIRFGSEGLLFYLLGEKAKRFIEKYFNLATIGVIILLVVAAYVMRKLGHMFGG